MSLCDACLKPGHCCKAMHVTGGSREHGFMQEPMSFQTGEHVAMRHGLPFRPLEQGEDGAWLSWWCTNLRDDGRCSDYENRPDLCRRYVAGSDRLCVHFMPTEDLDLADRTAIRLA